MSTLLPPNASPLEQAMADVLAGCARLPVRIHDLWNAQTCPAGQLSWLAWARSVDQWPTQWSMAQRRQATADSFQVHRHKGTVWALKQVISQFGGDIVLREWWQQTPPGPPHTFELILNLTDRTGAPASAAEIDAVIAAVHQVKPVRSHFTFNLGITGQSALRLAGGALAVTGQRLALTET